MRRRWSMRSLCLPPLMALLTFAPVGAQQLPRSVTIGSNRSAEITDSKRFGNSSLRSNLRGIRPAVIERVEPLNF